MGHSKGAAVALCLAVLVGGGWIALAARSTNDTNVRPAAVENSTPFLVDPNLTDPTGPALGSGALFAKMMLSIITVVILGATLLYVSRRVLPKVANAPGREIHIRETAHLGPRKVLYLVEVGHHRLLLGSTNDHITALAHLADPAAQTALTSVWDELSKQETDDVARP